MRTYTNNVPIYRLREAIAYDPLTGRFHWLIDLRNRRSIGKEAGTIIDGRRYIGLDGVRMLANRVAWAWMTGEWPTFEVDHGDNDSLNDRWANLREATRSQQACNSKTRSDNKLGMKGVSLHKKSGLYRARIGADRRSLGYFKTPDEAAQAYSDAAQRQYGEFARP